MDPMVTSSSTGPEPPGQSSLDLAVLRSRLETIRATATAEPDALVGDLETAYEELQVADEEVRTQQGTIRRLVASHHDLRLQQERMMGILPVPIIVTDMQGAIRSANAAASVLVGVRLARLVGRPIFGLFDLHDRPALRRVVSARRREGLVVRQTATLVPRGREPVQVDVAGSPEFPGAAEGEIAWMVLTVADREALHLTDALTALSMLPRRNADLAELLEAAARVCADALRADVTIALGSPLSPEQVASSSQLAQVCDGAQLMVGDGPSVQSYATRATVASADLAADERWGSLRERLPAGVGAVAATSIESGGRAIGTLTVYGRQQVAMVVESVELLAVTLVGVLHEVQLLGELARLESDMEQALRSRSVIDQAKGILMAAKGIDADAAFEHLVGLSSTHHVKVRVIAEQIVARASGQDGA